ncbi:MAG: hypothetical protein Kow0063_15650 [Anaerolineae bacterium]
MTGLLLVALGILLYVIPAPPCVEEVIQIFSPEPGAQVTSPVVITGFGGPAFEGTLQVEIYGESGEVVGRGYANIEAGEWGQRGPFQGEVEFTVDRMQPGQISVIIAGQRGAGIADIQHLSSVPVILAP